MFDSAQRNIHYLRLSVTDLCNLRCRYCMPDGVPKLAHEDILTYEEFLRLAALFAQCGIDTVRITGGEPLVRRGVEPRIRAVRRGGLRVGRGGGADRDQQRCAQRASGWTHHARQLHGLHPPKHHRQGSWLRHRHRLQPGAGTGFAQPRLEHSTRRTAATAPRHHTRSPTAPAPAGMSIRARPGTVYIFHAPPTLVPPCSAAS